MGVERFWGVCSLLAGLTFLSEVLGGVVPPIAPCVVTEVHLINHVFYKECADGRIVRLSDEASFNAQFPGFGDVQTQAKGVLSENQHEWPSPEHLIGRPAMEATLKAQQAVNEAPQGISSNRVERQQQVKLHLRPVFGFLRVSKAYARSGLEHFHAAVGLSTTETPGHFDLFHRETELLKLLLAFVAIFAVVYLVYCVLSQRKQKLAKPSYGRITSISSIDSEAGKDSIVDDV